MHLRTRACMRVRGRVCFVCACVCVHARFVTSFQKEDNNQSPSEPALRFSADHKINGFLVPSRVSACMYTGCTVVYIQACHPQHTKQEYTLFGFIPFRCSIHLLHKVDL